MQIQDPKRIHFEQQLLASLSPRERQILALFLEGMTAKEMSSTIVERDATQSLLSTKTVHTYKMSMRDKLGCANDIETVKFAVRHHLVDIWSKPTAFEFKARRRGNLYGMGR